MQTRSMSGKIATILLVLAGSLAASLVVLGASSQPAAAKQNPAPTSEELRAGKNFIATKVYSAEDDEQTLKLFEGPTDKVLRLLK